MPPVQPKIPLPWFRKLCLFTVLLLSACAGSGNDVFESSNLLGGGLAPGEVRALIFDEDRKASIGFSELSGQEEFTFLLFAANNDSSAYNFQVQAFGQNLEQKLLQLPELENSPEAPHDEGDATSRAHQILREAERDLVQGLSNQAKSLAISGKGLASGTPCAGGQGVSINVLTSLANTNQYSTTCALLVRQTNSVLYYLDEAAQGVLPQSALDSIINSFESKVETERALLGRESDVNGDDRFAVYFSPAVNRLGQASGGFVTGYFFGGDLFPESESASTNHREILFSCVPDPEGAWGTPIPLSFWASNLGPAVLPHEYQHMISFNQKVILQGESTEEPWLNEGLSHLMEDLKPSPDSNLSQMSIGGLSQIFADVGMENPSRVALYLNSPEQNPFTRGTSLAQRGGAYLALRYLYEQANLGRYPKVANGQGLLQALLSSGAPGVEILEESTGWEFKDILLDFFAALQISSSEISQDARYNFQGICLSCEQDDQRGTVLQGIKTVALDAIPASGSVYAPGGIFLSIDGESITRMGRDLSFIGSSGMIAGGAVIRTK